VEKNEEVATIWLNSPKDLNALSKELLDNITNTLDQLNKDKSIKVIVLRSRLEKFFCAGANIK
jgi:enoyl-CoA hydratase/carnithine racemase